MNELLLPIFSILVFLFSIVIHEVAHGYAAEHLGDPTARDAGRLTLNPVSHIDPIGSVLMPFILVLSGSPILFGWAKPVPYNPDNLRNPKMGAAQIAAAGPAANLVLAVAFGLLLRFLPYSGYSDPILNDLFAAVVWVNVLLAVFNLVPIPPLDGSKVLFAFLPNSRGSYLVQRSLEQYGFILLLLFIFFGFHYIVPIINFLFGIIAGQTLGF